VSALSDATILRDEVDNMSERNEKVVLEFIEAFGRGDVEFEAQRKTAEAS
jgi:hypothetical protein